VGRHEAVRAALAHVTHPTNGGARGLRKSCGALTNLHRRREMQCGRALAGANSNLKDGESAISIAFRQPCAYRGSLKSMLRNRLQLAYRNLKDTTPSLP
jgi:hypothetical protein